MIKQTKEKTELKGNKIELAKEFIALIDNLYSNEIMTKEDLYECVRLGTMTDEEFMESLLEALGEE